MPLIEEVSQPALWAMVEIYRGISGPDRAQEL